MMPELIPQEIYILERYTSEEYFLLVRDAWGRLVKHADACLDVFVNNLPADYRSRALEYQPDIVWGERVLPNFRSTLDSLFDSYIRLTHGDKQALGAAGHVTSDFSGFSRFQSSDWMDEPQVAEVIPNGGDVFWKHLGDALRPAANIETTVNGGWPMQFLGLRYGKERGPLNPPERWPKYRLNQDVRVSSGQMAPRTGFYLPLLEQTSPQFWIEGNEVFRAKVGLNEDGNQYRAKLPADWLLIERVEGEFVDDGLADLLPDGKGIGRIGRAPAGQLVPLSGWWYTPAQVGSRQHFKQGDVFPSIEGSDYGETFWLLSPGQS